MANPRAFHLARLFGQQASSSVCFYLSRAGIIAMLLYPAFYGSAGDLNSVFMLTQQALYQLTYLSRSKIDFF